MGLTRTKFTTRDGTTDWDSNMFSVQSLKGNLAPSGLQRLENHLAARAVRAAKQTLPFQGSTPCPATEDLLENIFGMFCIGK